MKICSGTQSLYIGIKLGVGGWLRIGPSVFFLLFFLNFGNVFGFVYYGRERERERREEGWLKEDEGWVVGEMERNKLGSFVLSRKSRGA